MPIYVSSTCVKTDELTQAVEALYTAGITSIELSGGTKWNPKWLLDLKNLSYFSELTFRLHNYFPCPHIPFVLNLASQNQETVDQSLSLISKALEASCELKSNTYSIHAGFCADLVPEDLGGTLKSAGKPCFDDCADRFLSNFSIVRDRGRELGVEVFVENNVLPQKVFKSFQEVNPFLFVDLDSIDSLQKMLDFKLLLDVAHLKVSAHTLGLDFASQLGELANRSTYFHLSDNDALSDQNLAIEKKSDMARQLLKLDNVAKKISLNSTVEVYSGLPDVLSTMELFEIANDKYR